MNIRSQLLMNCKTRSKELPIKRLNINTKLTRLRTLKKMSSKPQRSFSTRKTWLFTLRVSGKRCRKMSTVMNISSVSMISFKIRRHRRSKLRIFQQRFRLLRRTQINWSKTSRKLIKILRSTFSMRPRRTRLPKSSTRRSIPSRKTLMC